MNAVLRFLQRHVFLTGLLGALFLCSSVALLVSHAKTIRILRDEAAPLVSELPDLERRLRFLREQMELSQMQAALRTGSLEERIRVYVLPEKPSLDRLLAVFDFLREFLSSRGSLAVLSDVTVGEPQTLSGGIVSRSVSLSMDSTEEGMDDALTILRLTGMLTVGDVLTSEERRFLLRMTEEENPAAVVALEQFLSADILAYIGDSRAYDNLLARSFSTESAPVALQTVIDGSLLGEARRLLQGAPATTLSVQSLWPLQMLTLRDATVQQGGAQGWVRLSLTLDAWSRE